MNLLKSKTTSYFYGRIKTTPVCDVHVVMIRCDEKIVLGKLQRKKTVLKGFFHQRHKSFYGTTQEKSAIDIIVDKNCPIQQPRKLQWLRNLSNRTRQEELLEKLYNSEGLRESLIPPTTEEKEEAYERKIIGCWGIAKEKVTIRSLFTPDIEFCVEDGVMKWRNNI